MVAAFVRSHGMESVKAAGTTDTYALTATVPAGNLLVMALVHDNAAVASKPLVSSITKMSGESASWLHLGRALSTSTSTGAFADGELWAIKTTVDWTSGTSLTVTYDTTVTMKSQNILEYSGVEAVVRSTTGSAYSTTTTAASAATTGTTPVIGDLAVGLIFGSNVAATMAGDTDTTGGAWAGKTDVGSTGGSAATNNYGITQHKILTAASHQTLNNSAAMTAGNGAVVAILQATIDPLVTQAAYRVYGDGTETGSTALAAQDTAPTVVVSTDANVQVRVRLQETAGGISAAATDWKLQWEKNTSGTWTDVTPAGSLLDSYPDVNGSSTSFLNVVDGFIGQSFLGDGKSLTRAGFYLSKVGTPPGFLRAGLFAHTGTFGTGRGVDPVLTTSALVSANSLGTSLAWCYFDFDGSVILEAGTPYVIAVAPDTGTDTANTAQIRGDNTTPTHAGCRSSNSTGTWAASASTDQIFETYTAVVETVVPYDSASLTPTPTVASEQLAEDSGNRIGQVGNINAAGQSFLGDGRLLAQAKFKLARFSTSANVGPVWAELYAHTGTYGSFGTATGSVLATSTNTIDSLADIPGLGFTVGTWSTFNFDGSYTLTNGVPYVIVVRALDLGSGPNDGVAVRNNSSSASHPGNQGTRNSSGVWSGTVGDITFQVFTTDSTIPTTNRLGAGSGSFVAGKVSEDGLVDDLGWSASNYTEVLYSVTLKSADLANADSLRFRVLRNGVTTGLTYTAYPTITASKVTTPQGTGTGSWSFAGAAVGKRVAKASPVGAWSFAGAAVGKRVAKAAPVGSWSFTGAAVGTAPAVGPKTGTGAGTWVFTGAAVGKKTPKASPVGAWSFTGAAVGKRVAKAAPVGTFTFAGAAVGSAPAVGMKYGTATGTWAWVGAAVGKRTPKATGTGAWSFAGAAVGAAPAVGMKYGTATGTWTLTGAAVGKRVAKAAPAGTWTFTGTSVGDAPPNRGTATGTWNYTGVVVGKRVAKATTTGTWAWVGAAVGKRVAKATPTGAWAFAGAAVGYRLPKATATGSWSATGAAVGYRIPKATGTGAWVFTGAAAGKRTPKATGTGTWTWTGVATGTAPVVGQNDGFALGAVHWTGVASARTIHRATAAGTWNLTGTATGLTQHRGTTTGAWSFTGAAVGKKPAKAITTGTWTFAGTSVGKRTPKATPTGTWTFTGTSVGRRVPKATATGTWVYTGTAAGLTTHRATAVGSWLYVGTAFGDAPPNRATAVGTLTWVGVGVGLAPALDFADGTAAGVWWFTGYAPGLARLFATPPARTSVAGPDPRISLAAHDPRVSVAAVESRISVAPPERRVSVGAASDRISVSIQ